VLSQKKACEDISVGDLTLLISDPDPDPTWRVIADKGSCLAGHFGTGSYFTGRFGSGTLSKKFRQICVFNVLKKHALKPEVLLLASLCNLTHYKIGTYVYPTGF